MIRSLRTHDRPFPWRCGNCGERQVYRSATDYKTTIKYDQQSYEVELSNLELPTCTNCGQVVFDDKAGGQIDRALRQRVGLLQPDQIRAGRLQLGLHEKEFAAQLGVSEESLRRWEIGIQLQPRAVDREIRLFFEFPSVRDALSQLQRGDRIGETVRAS